MADATTEAPGVNAATIEHHRRLAAEFVDRHPVDAGIAVDVVDLDGVPAELVHAAESRPSRTVLYFHSGGFVAGSPGLARQLAGRLALACEATFLVPAYRLAPEHPFPAALDDAVTAYRWLAARCRPDQIAVAGASAGGAIALGALVRLRDARFSPPAAAFLLSPLSDLTLAGMAHDEQPGGDVLASASYLRHVVARYLDGADPSRPDASPGLADLRGLPPLHIEAASEERLAGDARALARRAEAAGVPVRLELVAGGIHTFAHADPDALTSREAIGRIAGHVHRHVAA